MTASRGRQGGGSSRAEIKATLRTGHWAQLEKRQRKNMKDQHMREETFPDTVRFFDWTPTRAAAAACRILIYAIHQRITYRHLAFALCLPGLASPFASASSTSLIPFKRMQMGMSAEEFPFPSVPASQGTDGLNWRPTDTVS